MKKILLLICACFMYIGLQAKVIQVDNNAGSTVKYTLLQKAIDDASTGDTLYIAGSPNDYDPSTTVRLDKKLTLIGPGFFLGENNQTQSNNQTAHIYDLVICKGADNSILIGLDFSESSISFKNEDRNQLQVTSSANNVLIKRNKIDDISIKSASGTIIEQNFFSSTYVAIYLDNTSSNTLIQNNIIATRSNYAGIKGPAYYGYSLTNTIIRNNTLTGYLLDLKGVEIDNNIFFSGNLNNCDNNVLKNNVWVSTEPVAIPTSSCTGNTYLANNNKFSVTAGDLFVKATPAVDNEFKLKASSPAAGAGIDGIDAGAFGGLNAYKLSGLPPIPSIYEVTTTGVGTKESGLKVVIKAKSNN